MASRCAHASPRSRPPPASASPRSRPLALLPPARRSSRHGSTWTCRNAVIASPARSCPQRRCSPPSRARPMAISTPPCPGTSVAAALMCESARESSAPRRVPATTRKGPEMISRRRFLGTGAALGGGLLIAFRSGPSIGAPTPESAASVPFAPNAFIRIGSDGQVVLTMPYVEMGQGTYTSIPMLIAEELEVDLKQVTLEHAPPDEKRYFNPLLGVQATGNSNAILGSWQPFGQPGAN